MSWQALEVNLNPLWYGVLAEIGAGQVIAPHSPDFSTRGLALVTLEALQTMLSPRNAGSGTLVLQSRGCSWHNRQERQCIWCTTSFPILLPTLYEP